MKFNILLQHASKGRTNNACVDPVLIIFAMMQIPRF